MKSKQDARRHSKFSIEKWYRMLAEVEGHEYKTPERAMEFQRILEARYPTPRDYEPLKK